MRNFATFFQTLFLFLFFANNLISLNSAHAQVNNEIQLDSTMQTPAKEKARVAKNKNKILTTATTKTPRTYNIVNNVQYTLSAPTSTAEHCDNINKDNGYAIFYLEENIIAVNSAGPYGTGLCWWVTRLTHRAGYLAELRPELTKPNEDEVKDILQQLKDAQHFVMIPGYKSFSDFYQSNQKIINDFLANWQRLNILDAGKYNLGYSLNPTPYRLWWEAKKAQRDLDNHRPTFIILKNPQEKGWIDRIFTAHSLLLLKATYDAQNRCVYFEARAPYSYRPLTKNEIKRKITPGIAVLRYCLGSEYAEFYETYKHLQFFDLKQIQDFIQMYEKNKNTPQHFVFYVQRELELRLVEEVAIRECRKFAANESPVKNHSEINSNNLLNSNNFTHAKSSNIKNKKSITSDPLRPNSSFDTSAWGRYFK